MLTKEFEQLSDPFIVNDSMESIQLDTKQVMDNKVMIIVKINEQISRKNYTESRKITIINKTVKLEDNITKICSLLSTNQVQEVNLQNVHPKK